MNIAVDSRGRHGRSSEIVFGDCFVPRIQCAADGAEAQGLSGETSRSA
jgi:hypothetical protein